MKEVNKATKEVSSTKVEEKGGGAMEEGEKAFKNDTKQQNKHEEQPKK